MIPDYHCIAVSGMAFAFHVDSDVRREVEHWLARREEDGPYPTLDIVTIYGEDVTLVRAHILNLYSSTTESRRLDREQVKALREEQPVEERE